MRWRNPYLTPLCNRVGVKNRLVVSLMTARSCPVLLHSVLAPGWACVLLWWIVPQDWLMVPFVRFRSTSSPWT